MAESKYNTIQQHQQLRVPAEFGRTGKQFVMQLDDILDDVYRRFGRLSMNDMDKTFRSRIEQDETAITEVYLDVSGLSLRMETAEGDISALNVRAGNIELEVADKYSKVSGIAINSNGVEISGSKYIKIKSGGSFSVDSGNFSIDTSGNVTINGSGTFSGALSAATGTFAGTLSAGNWEFNNNGQTLYKELSSNNEAEFRIKDASESMATDKFNCGIEYGFDQTQWSAHTVFEPSIRMYGGYKNVNGRTADIKITFHPSIQTTGLQTIDIDTVDSNTSLFIKASQLIPRNRQYFYSYIGKSDNTWSVAYIDNVYGNLVGNADTATKLSRAPTYGELSGR